MSDDRARAWDMYAAACLVRGFSAQGAADHADTLLAERDKRFPGVTARVDGDTGGDVAEPPDPVYVKHPWGWL